MKSMIRAIMLVSILFYGAWAVECAERYGVGGVELTLATGSPGELGLVKVLAEAFSEKHNASLCWVKAGSGKSLSLLKNKEVDVVMVHAPKAEKQAVAEGWASDRTLIGSNEFYIAGPKNDPAGIAKAKSAHEAYALIAKAKALFYTRADNSGTHKKELDIWKKASVE
ncbi:substrate-binding domain-containing protein, partial [Sulfurospirillum sp. T05]